MPELPKALDELVLSLLHADPLARPNSAAEVMQQLTQIADLPVEPNERQVAFSYLAHPPLVGRVEQLDNTRALLHRSVGGAHHTLIVEGSSGLGRSAFFDQVAIEAQLVGATVLRAQGGALGPFALAESLLRAGAQRKQPQSDHGATNAAELASSSAPESGGASPAEIAAHHASRVDKLTTEHLRLSAQGPLVLLVDDAERADPQSLAVLAALSRNADRSPLLLALAADKAAMARDSALQLIARNAQRVTMSPLRSSDLSELVTSVCGDVPNTRRLSLWLHEHGGGNPALSMELLRRLLLDGELQYTTGTFILPYDLPAPTHTHEHTATAPSRLRQLSVTALNVAKVLSLQRERLPVELIVAALDQDGSSTVAALDELVSKSVVRMEEGHVWIADEATRETLDKLFDDASRRACHLQFGRALLRKGYHEGIYRLLLGVNLLRGGDEVGGTKLIAETKVGSGVDPGYAVDSKGALSLLEAALENRRRQGISDEYNLPLLVALTNAGYYGDYRAQCRYGDRALDALFTVSGIRLAKRLSPLLGAKLALFIGLTCAVIRHVFMPQSARLGSFTDTMATFAMVAGATVASCASAIDVQKALQIMEHDVASRGGSANQSTSHRL